MTEPVTDDGTDLVSLLVAGQYSEAAWCIAELERVAASQDDTALKETAAEKRIFLTQVQLIISHPRYEYQSPGAP